MTARLGHPGGGTTRNIVPDTQQSLPFFTQPTKESVPVRNRTVKNHGERYLQDILWKESLLAVKISVDCQTVAELISRFQESLPQNSPVTRRRNTSTILGRFFPTEDLHQLSRQVLQAYDDETLLAAVLRVLFLEAEPLVGKLIGVVVSGWSMVWGNPVVEKTNYALHFRIVYLLDQAPVDPHTLHDDRIAVVIPGKWEDIARDISRRYAALVKMEEDYKGKQGPDVEEIKRFIDDELKKAKGEIVFTQKQLYRAGRIVTQAGLGIDPNQTFADPEKADEMIAAALLANAYTAHPFDANVFRKEFSNAEAGKVFNALFNGSTQSGDLSAVENFGFGLGLTSMRKPKEFDPSHCMFFSTIREELTRARGEMRLYSFYEKYTGVPYGLLEDMVTLYLLAFVRFSQPHCYLTVKSEAGLKLKTGKAPLDNRIGPADVVQVALTRGRLHRALDRLVQAVGPSWNDLVEFARVFDDSLKATTEREEVETQQDRLLKAQGQWHEKIERIQPRLQRLAQATHGDVGPYLALVGQVDRVCCTASLDEFEHVLQDEFERDKEKFSAVVEQVKALDELDRRYAQSLLDALAYLDALEGIPGESALMTERDLIQARFALDAFCKQPSQAGAVLEAFEQFKRTYSTQYQIHYRDYRQQLVALEARLKKLARKVDGLGRMNQIEELGGAVGVELPIQYKDLLARCDSKDLSEELPEVKDHPVFRGITLSTEAPGRDVAELENRLDEALHDRLWQLADETIAAILKDRGDTPLQALLEAIQAADAMRLAEHFTAEVADLVSQILRDARLVTETCILPTTMGRRSSAMIRKSWMK